MALQLIKPTTVDQLAAVLRPIEVGIVPIEVRFQDYLIRTDAIAPAANEWQQFRWQQKDNVWQRGTETQRLQWQWLPQGNPIPRAGFATAHGADPILQLDTAAGTHIFANVPLARLYQDEEVLYWAFKLGNGASGRNRWFGRSENDARPVAITEQLGADVRAALQTAFPGPLLYPDGASATPWLILARIPLAELSRPTRCRSP